VDSWSDTGPGVGGYSSSGAGLYGVSPLGLAAYLEECQNNWQTSKGWRLI